jgi:hypothetical protein
MGAGQHALNLFMAGERSEYCGSQPVSGGLGNCLRDGLYFKGANPRSFGDSQFQTIVTQAFQPAGSGDFPAASSGTAGTLGQVKTGTSEPHKKGAREIFRPEDFSVTPQSRAFHQAFSHPVGRVPSPGAPRMRARHNHQALSPMKPFNHFTLALALFSPMLFASVAHAQTVSAPGPAFVPPPTTPQITVVEPNARTWEWLSFEAAPPFRACPCRRPMGIVDGPRETP